MEGEHRSPRENECRNDRLVRRRFSESLGNDERQAKLIAEEIEKERCSQLDSGCELSIGKGDLVSIRSKKREYVRRT